MKLVWAPLAQVRWRCKGGDALAARNSWVGRENVTTARVPSSEGQKDGARRRVLAAVVEGRVPLAVQVGRSGL